MQEDVEARRPFRQLRDEQQRDMSRVAIDQVSAFEHVEDLVPPLRHLLLDICRGRRIVLLAASGYM